MDGGAGESRQKPMPYNEIHYSKTCSQSCIYCSTKLRFPGTTQERLLVGELTGKVSCVERRDGIHAREVYFTYIPGDAQLISMDCFYQHQRQAGMKCLTVGITLILIKDGEDAHKHFFNTYSALQPGSEFDLDNIAQSCEHHELDFTPYILTHADIYSGGEYEQVFLLGGSDKKIQMYRGSRHKLQSYEKKNCEKYFPEFSSIPANVVWLDTKNCEDFRRLSAVGCENGHVRAAVADMLRAKLISSWQLQTDGPISSVRLFTFTYQSEFFSTPDWTDPPGRKPSPVEDYNLLVTGAIELAAVFVNVSTYGFANIVTLNQSDQFDCVTCSCIADVDGDGNMEVILGTYGKVLLVYKWHANEAVKKICYDILWQRDFASPLLSIHSLDLTGDGMPELVLVTQGGVHVLRHDVDEAVRLLHAKFLTMPKDFALATSEVT